MRKVADKLGVSL